MELRKNMNLNHWLFLVTRVWSNFKITKVANLV